mgnify:CR=1 FL=1
MNSCNGVAKRIFSISSFFPYGQGISYEAEIMYNQVSIEFIYRCLKCDLIMFLNGSIFYLNSQVH